MKSDTIASFFYRTEIVKLGPIEGAFGIVCLGQSLEVSKQIAVHRSLKHQYIEIATTSGQRID